MYEYRKGRRILCGGGVPKLIYRNVAITSDVVAPRPARTRIMLRRPMTNLCESIGYGFPRKGHPTLARCSD